MKHIRCGIIGCGGYSGAHARRLRARPEVRITALCSRTEGSIARLIDRRLSDYTPIPAQYTSTREMLSREALDAVVIATPHHLHYQHAVEAIEAGCHVLIEKPMVTTLGEAQKLYALVGASTGLQAGVCYNPAYSPAVQRVQRVVKSGRYGTLGLVNGYLAQDWKRLTAGTWRQDRARSGGGQLMDSGAHVIYSLLSSVGSPPVEVFACTDREEVDINSVVAVRFADGVLATLAIGGNTPHDASRMTFIFDHGRVEVDGWNGHWYREYGPGSEFNEHSDSSEPNPDDNFIDAVLGIAEPKATVSDGLAMASFMDALYRSVESGTPISIAAPPEGSQS